MKIPKSFWEKNNYFDFFSVIIVKVPVMPEDEKLGGGGSCNRWG